MQVHALKPRPSPLAPYIFTKSMIFCLKPLPPDNMFYTIYKARHYI